MSKADYLIAAAAAFIVGAMALMTYLSTRRSRAVRRNLEIYRRNKR